MWRVDQGEIDEAQGTFYSGKIMHGTLMVDMRYYTLVKTFVAQRMKLCIVKISFGRSGDPRKECRTWIRNLTVLQIYQP